MNLTFPMTVFDEKFDDMAQKVMKSKILDRMKPEQMFTDSVLEENKLNVYKTDLMVMKYLE